MSKTLKGLIFTLIALFITVNCYFIFKKDSPLAQSFYVKHFERMKENHYEHHLMKDSILTSRETYTVTIDDESKVESWLVKEGEEVFLGQELALLNGEKFESERELLENEHGAFLEQQSALEAIKSELESFQYNAHSNANSHSGANQTVTEVDGKTLIELGMNINLNVDISQDGAYAQAIAAIDQQLSDIERQLKILEIKLEQDHLRPALISPVTGYVASIVKDGSTISIDLYDEMQMVVTYVDEAEWHQLEEGQGVTLMSQAFGEPIDGNIQFVSPVPATDSQGWTAYQQQTNLDEESAASYYEVQIELYEHPKFMPFYSSVSSQITIDEAYEAVKVPHDWGIVDSRERLFITKLGQDGKPTLMKVENPFNIDKHRIVSEGLSEGEVVIHHPEIYRLDEAPRIYLPFPTQFPPKEEWKSFTFKNYMEALFSK